MDFLHVFLLALVEGLTEFIPVSSTGHMILAASLFGIPESEFLKTFEIAIQLGAIMAVVVLYWKRFFQGLDLYVKLAIAFIPTGIVGLLAYKTIKTLLFNPTVVAVSLIAGGIVLILVDKWVEKRASKWETTESVSYKNAFFIGLIQCVSMIPGVSRAAATILGGVVNGFDKKQATEFSFLLAVPTMAAATGYDLLKNARAFTSGELQALGLGLVLAFVSALLAIRVFIRLVEKFGFAGFGWYRIVVGVLFLLFAGSLTMLD
jgi:undecaprenyl-diphosphatase